MADYSENDRRRYATLVAEFNKWEARGWKMAYPDYDGAFGAMQEQIHEMEHADSTMSTVHLISSFVYNAGRTNMDELHGYCRAVLHHYSTLGVEFAAVRLARLSYELMRAGKEDRVRLMTLLMGLQNQFHSSEIDEVIQHAAAHNRRKIDQFVTDPEFSFDSARPL